MHIVHIPRRFVTQAWGGTETVVLETNKRLLGRGHHSAILCPNALAETDQESIEGVSVIRVPYFYPYWGLCSEAKRQLDYTGGNLFSFTLLRTLQRWSQLDLIHLHSGKRLGGIGRYVAQQRNIPYVISLHGGVYDVPPEEVQRWTAPTAGTVEWGKVLGWWVGSRRVLDDAAAILCVGHEEYRQTQQRLPHVNVRHVPNGVDPARFANGNGCRFRARYGIAPAASVLLVMGRIDPQKNQLLPVQLLPMLRQQIPDVHLVCVGPVTNEPYACMLRKSLHASGLASHVTLIEGLPAGSQALVDAYHAADVLLLPSIHEPFGIVVLEAWAAGLPVIASRVGGLPALICDGEDGVLCDAHDSQVFAQAIRAVLVESTYGRRLGLAGQRKAQEQYSWDAVTEQVIRIYEDAMAGFK